MTKNLVYRYIDQVDKIVKYVGIVHDQTLDERYYQHRFDQWFKNSTYKVEYIEVNSRSEAEAIESHLIALYETFNYYNIAKKDWGLINSFPTEFDWKEYEVNKIITNPLELYNGNNSVELIINNNDINIHRFIALILLNANDAAVEIFNDQIQKHLNFNLNDLHKYLYMLSNYETVFNNPYVKFNIIVNYTIGKDSIVIQLSQEFYNNLDEIKQAFDFVGLQKYLRIKNDNAIRLLELLRYNFNDQDRLTISIKLLKQIFNCTTWAYMDIHTKILMPAKEELNELFYKNISIQVDRQLDNKLNQVIISV